MFHILFLVHIYLMRSFFLYPSGGSSYIGCVRFSFLLFFSVLRIHLLACLLASDGFWSSLSHDSSSININSSLL